MARKRPDGSPRKAKGAKKNRKFGRNSAKCQRYRARVGKPRGRGVLGNKSGKNAR